MATFTISKASPIHFRIETGAGTINAGSSLPENYLYPDMQTFYDCKGFKVIEQAKAQKYECSDTTDIQVYLDDTGLTNPGLVMHVNDEDGNILDLILPTTPYAGDGVDYYNFNIDWSLYTCPGCYHLHIRTYELDTGVSLNWGDNGTFENAGTWNSNWVTGGTNVRLQSGAQFHTGIASAAIVAPAVPTALEGLVLQTGSATIFTFVANTVYEISMYVRDDGALPFTQNGHQLRIDVNGLTDGTIISETTVIPSVAGRDAWHEIKTVFLVATDITGRFDLVHETTLKVQTAPQASGLMFTDTHTMSKGTEVVQATSESIDLRSNWPCTALVEYYGDNPQFNMYYNDAEYAARFRYREDIGVTKWAFEDEDFDAYRNSAGTYKTVAGYPEKVYQFVTGIVAPFMAEIIGLSTIHDNVTIDGITYVRKEGAFDPEWLDHGGGCTIEVEMRLSGYDNQKSLCD